MNPTVRERSRRAERGVALLESVVSVFLLGVLVTSAFGGLMFGITGAHQGRARTAASAWQQAEFDYLLLQSYSGLAVSTRTLTRSTGYTIYGDYAEPSIPSGFDHAVVDVRDLIGVPVKQLTVTLYQTPSSPYATFSTYLSNFTVPR